MGARGAVETLTRLGKHFPPPPLSMNQSPGWRAGVGVCTPQRDQHRHVQAQAQQAVHGRICQRLGRSAPADACRCGAPGFEACQG
eukprot:366388-Chlamydomonas_euryale.AAC.12